jgi:hypothetical protein
VATKIKLKPSALSDPSWSVATAKPGDTVELAVTAKGLQAGQSIEFSVRNDHGPLTTLTKPTATGDRYKASWVVPNTFGVSDLVFDALLRETPSPKNGHVTSRGKVRSGKLAVQGFQVAIRSTDAAFVPHAEKLAVKLDVRDDAGVAVKGRVEIWGERYPSGKPLFTQSFTPLKGAMDWSSWDGKANAGTLAGNYITPEFSPYRVRVIIGLDDASCADPQGAGKGKVAIAEHAFEVRFESVTLRVQAGLPPGIVSDLASLLQIEPTGADARLPRSGRLPLATETARIRIPSVRYIVIGESLAQGKSPGPTLPRIPDSYAGVNNAPLAGNGQTKFAIDAPIYSRPEIPVEIEGRLQSRDPAKNKATQGLFQSDAIGPALFEVFADDIYSAALYAPATPEATYLKNAALSIKHGAHYAPANTAGAPIIGFWQERFEVAADGARDFATARAFKLGSNELTLYLNRTRLSLGAALDYVEVDATHVKLKQNLTRRGDVLWILRSPSAALPAIGGVVPAGEAAPPAVTTWVSFPPGDNCHAHYGGLRGSRPNPALLDKFSAAGAGSERILGKGAPFPYAGSIDLNPDKDPAGGERVQAKALTAAGGNQGLAGVVFSPSLVAGDSYALEVALGAAPYERSLGALPGKARHKSRSGTMTVWRLCSITGSFKLPGRGRSGLRATVGLDDPALGGRAHPGDGAGMNVATLNTVCQSAFNEWDVPVPAVPVAAGEPHQDVPLATYRATHNAQNGALALAGFPNLATNADVTNEFVQYDYYRDTLPPGIPPNRVNAVSNAIAALPAGTLGPAAAAAAQAAITARNNAINPVTGAAFGPAGADVALAVGVVAIPISPLSANNYKDAVEGTVESVAHAHLDAITPQVAAPRSMTTVRWPNYFSSIWFDGTPGAMQTGRPGTVGFCRGSGQSFFAAVGGNPDTFEHEMGHSLHLRHFVTRAASHSYWKHHDTGYAACKMGYNNAPGTGLLYSVPLPVAAVGPAITLNTGARNLFCAKCLLKMRGWNEILLPCSWTHPDVL